MRSHLDLGGPSSQVVKRLAGSPGQFGRAQYAPGAMSQHMRR